MLQQMVADYGPISVRIDANHDSFKNYKGGQCINIGLVVIVRLYIFFNLFIFIVFLFIYLFEKTSI